MGFDGRQSEKKSRTREGCRTCIKRKKKCDATCFPCTSCIRLGLTCERTTVLVWEDDVRRIGMKRRGPPALKKRHTLALENPGESSSQGMVSFCPDDDFSLDEYELNHVTKFDNNTCRSEVVVLPSTSGDPMSQDRQLFPSQVVRYQHLSDYPHTMSTAEALLLDNYIQRFSRMYPTNSGPSNPFLSILLPLAMRNDVVFNSLLALSGVQRWEYYEPYMEWETLRLRQRALRGCRLLLEEYGFGLASSGQNYSGFGNEVLVSDARGIISGDFEYMDEEKALILLTTSTLLLLYEQISGELNWKPHLEFVNRLFNHFFNSSIGDSISDGATGSETSETMEALRYLHNLFLYVDLVRSTSLRTSTLSKFYLRAAVAEETIFAPPPTHLDLGIVKGSQSRYYFPNLIARISSGDYMVSDADIMAWNGNLDWLPSLSLMGAEIGIIPTPPADVLQQYPNSGVQFWQEKDWNSSDLTSWDEQTIITELYRTVALIYKRQITGENEQLTSLEEIETIEVELSASLASWAIQLVQLLPEGSAFESTLLWPIGIAAKELPWDCTILREYIISRLQSLEQRFQMKYYRSVQNVLTTHWRNVDSGTVIATDQSVTASEAILLG